MPDHPTCATCKHWNRVHEIGGFCFNRKLNGHENARLDLYDDQDHLDGSAGEYVLTTGPDFGCIHHEPAEPPRAA